MKSNSSANRLSMLGTRFKSNYRAQVVVAMALASLIPALTIGIFLWVNAQNAIQRELVERLRTGAAYRGGQLQGWLDSLTGSLSQVRTDLPNLAQAMRELQIPAITLDLKASLDRALSSGQFAEIMLISDDNKILYSTNIERYTAPKRTCSPRIVCASEYLPSDKVEGIVYLMVQYPIPEANGGQAGVLLGLAETRTLDILLSNKNGLGTGGISYLVNTSRNISWLPGMGANPGQGAKVPSLDTSTIQIVDAGEYQGALNVEVHGVSVWIPRLFAWLIVEQGIDGIYLSPNELLVVVTVTFWLVVVLMLGASGWIGYNAETTIDALRDDARSLRAKLAKASESEQRRSRALADMGHELRTPINSTLNLSGFLTDGLYGKLTDDQMEPARQIHSSSQHLLELINDLIDISQVEAGQMRLYVQDYDPAPVFEQALGTLGGLILDKPITIESDLPRTWPTMRGDRRRVLQILLNLVSNAAKFTERGTIIMRAHTFSNRIEVRVEDSGTGVDPDVMAVMFEPFSYNASGHEKGGTGLGLALSRIFARMHGGDLTWQPAETGGAAFILTLPINAIEPSPATLSDPPTPETAPDAASADR